MKKLDLRGKKDLPPEVVLATDKIATMIIRYDYTFYDIEREMPCISRSTANRYIHRYLPRISKVRYNAVLRVIERHKRFKKGKRGK